MVRGKRDGKEYNEEETEVERDKTDKEQQSNRNKARRAEKEIACVKSSTRRWRVSEKERKASHRSRKFRANRQGDTFLNSQAPRGQS